MPRWSTPLARRTLPLLVAHALMLGWLPGANAIDPNALPAGGVVVGGAAVIQQSGPVRMDIQQQSSRAAIDWQSFNIGSAAHVNFAQPSSSSVALNRVLSGGGASEILGRLTANGQVFLVNPQGVLFGPGAQVNIGGLVASTLDIGPQDFVAGRATFAKSGSAAGIVNQGSIVAADGGYVALLAPEVRNEGIVTARLGTVALGAGERVTLDFAGDRLINLHVDAGAVNTRIDNRHLVQADGGLVVMSASAAGDIASSVVNNEALVQAASLVERGGVIRLEGDHVRLAAGSRLDVSASIEAGSAPGGNILVGGGYRGQDASMRNARSVTVEAGASLAADGAGEGSGGKVIVWSDGTTRFSGDISAQGGKSGGAGGFAEVSGKEVLRFRGTVDTGGGTLLLDPANITVQATSDNGDDIRDVLQIDALLGANNLVLDATNDITWSDNTTLAYTNTSDRTLTLQAGNSIVFNSGASIVPGSGAAALSVVLNADRDVSGAGNIQLINTAINSNGGAITLGGGANPLTTAAIGVGLGSAQEKAGIYLLNSTLTSGAGVISLRGQGAAGTANAYGVLLAGSAVGSGTGAIRIHGTGGAGTRDNYGVYLADSGTVVKSVEGNILITGQGGAGSETDGHGMAIKTNNRGIVLDGGSVVESTGTGVMAATVTLQGMGNTGINENHGVLLRGSATEVKSAEGDILISGTGGPGNGIENHGIRLDDGAVVKSTGTGAGAAKVTLEGTGGAGTYFNYGVSLADANTAVNSIDGDILITGQGVGSGDGNHGVHLTGYAAVNSTGTGANAAKVTLQGTGGAGMIGGDIGVVLATATVKSDAGDISIAGQGGTGSGSNFGILVTGATVESTGTGTGAAKITLQGTGGAGTNGNTGIVLYGGGVPIFQGAAVRSVAGDISITGVGGAGSSGSNSGITLLDGATVESTGTGAVMLHGTGGAGTSGNYGVYLSGIGMAVRSIDGDISITGQGAGSGTHNHGIQLGGAQAVESTGTGALTLKGTASAGTDQSKGVLVVGNPNIPVVKSATGDIVIVAAGGGGTNAEDFYNDAGGSVTITTVASTSGRWLIYTSSPGSNFYGGLTGGLVSGQTALYGRTFASNPPSSITETGNRYIFAATLPSLTVSSSFSDSKSYGDTYSFPTPVAGTHYALTGFNDASVHYNVWTQDTAANIGLSGAPVLSSSGVPATADVGDYAIGLGLGTLSSTAGYGFAVGSSSVKLTVNKSMLIVTADDKSREYGEANPPLTGQIAGFKLSQNASVLTTQPSYTTTADLASNPGNYVIMALGAAAQNYNFTYVPGMLTVIPDQDGVPAPALAPAPALQPLATIRNTIAALLTALRPQGGLDGGPLATLGGATGSRIAGGNLSPTLGGPTPGAVTNVMQTISLGNGSTIQVMNSGLSLPEGTSDNSGGR